MKPLALPSVRFVLVGIANTLAGLLAIYTLKLLFGLNDVLANLFGYALGFCVSYLLNARWTFSFRGSLAARAPRYAAVVVCAYLVNIATVGLVLYGLHVNSYLAQAAGVLPYALITYFGSKILVFGGHSVPAGESVAQNFRR